MLHLILVSGFALAQPIYDLLGQYPTFFVFRSPKPTDFIVLVLLLSLLIPLALFLVIRGTGVLSLKLQSITYTVVFAVLAAVFFLPPIGGRMADQPGWLVVLLALIAGSALAIVRVRALWFRQLLSFMALAALVFPAVFLFRDGIRQQWLVSEISIDEGPDLKSSPNLIVLVFDALPTASLMDDQGGIDAVRYPNFARLAEDSTWFRRALTVADFTQKAVPAILSGRCPQKGSAPIFSSHPHNLFTLFGNRYEFEVQEWFTRLCPPSLCSSEQQPFGERLIPLLSDITFVFLHRILPESWAVGLPNVDTNWGNFGHKITKKKGSGRGTKNQVERYRQLLSRLGKTSTPTLLFAHLPLPHPPYFYLPSGRMYRKGKQEPGGGIMPDDPWIARRSYQRHLLQLGFADTLLGELLDRLEEIDFYQQSLIVVTADHGTSFRAGEPKRNLSNRNEVDILPVPLLIKRPFAAEGSIVDQTVQTVDILAMVTESLEIEKPSWIEGRTRSEILRGGPDALSCGAVNKRTAGPISLDRLLAATHRKNNLVGVGGDAGELPQIGPHPELVGVSVAESLCADPADLSIQLENPQWFSNVQPNSEFVPAEIVGTVHGLRASSGVDLAVAVDGVVRATTRTYRRGGPEERTWSAIVPETVFRRSNPEINVFMIDKGRTDCALRRTNETTTTSLPRFLGVHLGVWKVPNVVERGPRTIVKYQGGHVRWTRKRVEIEVPLSRTELGELRRLRIDLAASGPDGADLRIALNGRSLFDQRIEPGAWSQSFEVTPQDRQEPMILTLESSTFKSGGRRYGVAVEGIWFLPDTTASKSGA